MAARECCAGCFDDKKERYYDACDFCDEKKYCPRCRSCYACEACDSVVCVSCRPTCVQCGHTIEERCKECAAEKRVHYLDDCDEEMCTFCRRETLVQLYGKLDF